MSDQLKGWLEDNLPPLCHDCIPYIEAVGYFHIEQLGALLRDTVKNLHANDKTKAFLRQELKKKLPQVEGSRKKKITEVKRPKKKARTSKK